MKMLYSPEAEGQCLNLVVESVGQQQVRGHVCQLEQAGHLAGQLLCPLINNVSNIPPPHSCLLSM